MFLFVLVSIPSCYLLALSCLKERKPSISLIARPLMLGAASFFIYAIVDNAVSGLFSDSYLWNESVVKSAIGDQILPITTIIILFLLFFNSSFKGDQGSQKTIFLSFCAGFFTLLALRDLVAEVKDLDLVDLFYRPIGRIIMLFLLPWALEKARARPQIKYLALSYVIVAHILIALSCATQYLNYPFWAAFLMGVAVLETVYFVRFSKLSHVFVRPSTIP